MRARVCRQCGVSFQYEIGIGKDRYLCSDFCRLRARAVHAKMKPLCVVDGCKNHRGYSSGICNACYTRLKRTGTLERRRFVYRCVTTNGYIKASAVDHPLATRGYVYEHRMILFDAIGNGPHPCYWCTAPVQWIKGACSKGALVVDHLDGDKQNNALGNLVPACNRCNANRGVFMAWVQKRKDDPVLWRMYEAAIARGA